MAIASKTTAVKMPNVAAAETLDASALVKVRNTSNQVLNLSSGPLPAGEEGQATVAEASMLSEYLVRL